MKLLLKPTFPWFLILPLAIAVVWQWNTFHRNQTALARLRVELADGGDIHAELESLQQMRDLANEQERLRADNVALRQSLRGIVAQRRAEDAELEALRGKNEKLREASRQWENSPATIEATHVFESSQMLQIAQAFIRYATINDNRIPTNFSDLQGYAAANVFAAFETNRYEIVAPSHWGEIQNRAQTPLVRSKQINSQKQRLYLYADGHCAMQQE